MLIPFCYLPLDRIRGIIHIGAHECEELDSYIQDADRPVIWIEANPEKIPVIQKKISNYNLMCVVCFAASNIYKTNSILHVASNGQSSSLLEPGTHLDHHPSISFNKVINVPEQRIDTYIDREGIDVRDFNFINLDIQGYELKALQGASEILSKIDFIYTEVNTEDVYKDCASLTEIDNFLSHYGFSRTWLSLTRNGWGDAFYSRGNRYLNKTSFITRASVEKIKRKFAVMGNKNLIHGHVT